MRLAIRPTIQRCLSVIYRLPNLNTCGLSSGWCGVGAGAGALRPSPTLLRRDRRRRRRCRWEAGAGARRRGADSELLGLPGTGRGASATHGDAGAGGAGRIRDYLGPSGLPGHFEVVPTFFPLISIGKSTRDYRTTSILEIQIHWILRFEVVR